MSVEKSLPEQEATPANRHSAQAESDNSKGPQVKHLPVSEAVVTGHPILTLMNFSSLITMFYKTATSIHSSVTSNFTRPNAKTGSVLASLMRGTAALQGFCVGIASQAIGTFMHYMGNETVKDKETDKVKDKDKETDKDKALMPASTNDEAGEEKRTSIRQNSIEIPDGINKVASEWRALESLGENINPAFRQGSQIIYRRIEVLTIFGPPSRGDKQGPNDIWSAYAEIVTSLLPAEMQRVVDMAADAENRANTHSDRSDMDEQQMLLAMRPLLTILASLQDVMQHLPQPHVPNIEWVPATARTLLDEISSSTADRSGTASISTLETATLARTPQSESSERSVSEKVVEMLRSATPVVSKLFAQQHTKDNRRDSIWSTQGQINLEPDSNGQGLAPDTRWEFDRKKLNTEQLVDALWKIAEHKSGKSA